MTFYAPVKIPGYEALIVKRAAIPDTKELACPVCPDGLRFILKSGKYDPYCKTCRSAWNKKYRQSKGQPEIRKPRNSIMWGTL